MVRGLSNNDIEDALAALDDGAFSEDDEDGGDLDDLDYNPNLQDLVDELEGDIQDHEGDPPIISEENVLSDEPPSEAVPRTSSLGRMTGIMAWRQRSRELIWKKRSFTWDDDRVAFLGSSDLPPSVANLQNPLQFFSLFLDEDMIQKIVDETNLYINQKSVSHCAHVNSLEIRQFLGILLFMTVYHYPNVRSYWSKYGFRHIMETMTLNRFEKIRSFIHFNDNFTHKPVGHVDHDRLHKLRPLVEHFNKTFTDVAPFEQRLSLDEQMCATKVGHFMKQYLPNKPHKWGFKLFVLCSLPGYAYKFEVYTGKQDHQILPDEPDLGVVGNTVIRLCRQIPRRVNHVIYFDNFYTSIPLLHYLETEGIHALGTIQRNRLGKTCKLPTQKDYMKDSVPRGSYEEQTTHYDGVDISVTTWKDNKLVTLASTYVGAEPVDAVSRFDKKLNRKISIPCPKIIKDYNAHMGGVDLMDSFLGRYRIRVKSRKWYIRLFYHMIDMAVINSWILYKKATVKRGEKKVMNLGEYRSELAESLCNYKKPVYAKRGRPSSMNIESELEQKKHRGPMKDVPPKEVRTDGVDYDEERVSQKGRCKLPGCKGFSRTKCLKCQVNLCHTLDRNCFAAFHK